MFRSNVQQTAVLYVAAKSGNLEEVKENLEKYKNQGLKPDRETLLFAIESNKLSLVKYLLTTFPELKSTMDHIMVETAARTGNIEMLNFFLQRQFYLRADTRTLCEAVESGNLDMAKYLVDDYGLAVSPEVHEFAKNNGTDTIVSYFQEKLTESRKLRL